MLEAVQLERERDLLTAGPVIVPLWVTTSYPCSLSRGVLVIVEILLSHQFLKKGPRDLLFPALDGKIEILERLNLQCDRKYCDKNEPKFSETLPK